MYASNQTEQGEERCDLTIKLIAMLTILGKDILAKTVVF